MTTWLEGWNPLTPLAVAVLLVAVTYSGPQPWSAAAALAIALALAWRSGVGWRVARLVLAAGLPTFLLLFFLNGVVVRVPNAAHEATGFAMRLAASVAALGWLVVGLNPRRLTQAMTQRGLPSWGAYVIVASLEAVPRARARAKDVMDAQRCRGLSTRGAIVGRLRALAALAGPLAVSLVTESEERALALDARGFRPFARRTSMTPVPDPARERVARTVLWTSLAVLLAWKLVL